MKITVKGFSALHSSIFRIQTEAKGTGTEDSGTVIELLRMVPGRARL